MKIRYTNFIRLIAISCILVVASCNGQDAKLASFAKQEHRFEVRDCEFFYNGEHLELYHPKSYYEERFGTGFEGKGNLWHKTKPIIVRERIRSLKQKNIRDVTNILINFITLSPDHINYNKFRKYSRLTEGNYMLIDGIPFGNGVSIKALNSALKKKGKLPFSGSFAGSSGIKARGFTNCENFPQFFISYDDKGNLQDFSYLIRKPKNLK